MFRTNQRRTQLNTVSKFLYFWLFVFYVLHTFVLYNERFTY